MNFCPYCNIGIDRNQMIARRCNNCSHEWEVYHVYPVSDLREHRLSHLCSCNPTITNEGYNMTCVHNSFDGREGVEWANELLKK